jgi:transposase-like protein
MSATPAIIEARRAHSSRCRQRVIKALNDAVACGEQISVSAISRKAGVDRSFFYRHRDLHAQVMAKAAEPPASPDGGPSVSRASLIAVLAAAHERAARLTQHNRQLQQRLSELLGEQAWRQSGLGAPADIDALQQQITGQEQQIIELRRQLCGRDEELEAARATNREFITRLNRHPPH